MQTLFDRLPRRFPVGTRYVIEGRRAGDGDLRISLRCVEFPDGRQVQLPADQARLPAAKARRRRARPNRQGRAARTRKSARK